MNLTPCDRLRLIYPPTDPDGPLPAIKGVLQLRAVLTHPPVDGGVIHEDTPLAQEFFDMARAQWIHHVPTDPHQNEVLGEVGSLETHGPTSSPSLVLLR